MIFLVKLDKLFMNIIKSTFDFLGQHWSLMKTFDDYHFFTYNKIGTQTYQVSLYLKDKTADGLFKQIQAEIKKYGFKVKKDKVIKHGRKNKSTNKNLGRNTRATRNKGRTKRKKS